MQVLIATVVCFLAVYGVIQLLENLVTVKSRRKRELQQTHIVLRVKNQQDTIEGVIRAITWEPGAGEIIVIDMDSDDDTPVILKRLEDEFPFLHCMSKQEYIAYIANS